MGKLGLAQIIHGMGERRQYPFVVADCNPRQRYEFPNKSDADTPSNRAALRENLHELLGAAYKGTLYVRSLGHLCTMVQEVFAEVLAEGKCILPHRKGLIPFQGRIIFSTNHPINQLQNEGCLAKSLYPLITENVIKIPSLVEYKEDIESLAEAFVILMSLHAKAKVMEISDAAYKAIRNHPWKGNFVELYEVMRHAMKVAHNNKIQVYDLHLEEIPEKRTEEDIIRDVLSANKGNKRKTARDLNICPNKLYSLMRQYNIPMDFK